MAQRSGKLNSCYYNQYHYRVTAGNNKYSRATNFLVQGASVKAVLQYGETMQRSTR